MSGFLNFTMGELLEDKARKHPDHQAVKYIEREFDLTYGEFNEEVDSIAKGLMAMGFEKGDHIAVWATNYPEWLTLLFATAKIGAVLVTVNTSYKLVEFEYIIKHSKAKGLFICDGLKDIDCEKTLYEMCPEIRDSQPDNLNLEKLPHLKKIISMDNLYKGMYHWRDLHLMGKKISEKEYDVRKNSLSCHDIVNIQYTSGTTGFPKGVMLTHYNIINNGKCIGDCMKLSPKDRMCIPVPFFHCFGLVLSILACVTHGSTMVPLLFFTPMKMMHTIEYERCTAANGVPTMFISMLEHRDFAKYNFSSLRTGIMSGTPCPMKAMQDVMDKMNMKEITIAYGLTEASPVCTMTTTDDSVERRVSTVGKVLPGVTIKIIDPETGKELGPDVPGELCIKGYSVMRGYFEMPKETAEVVDEEGWLHTGDLAVVDSDGYYKITGRIKDMIIRGGENIYPKEIEEFLYTHPAVSEVQVIGVPSKMYGEEIVACIILKPETSATEDDIRNYVSDNMARHKVPKYVKFMKKFPMTASGKIQKYKLREMAKKEFGQEK